MEKDRKYQGQGSSSMKSLDDALPGEDCRVPLRNSRPVLMSFHLLLPLEQPLKNPTFSQLSTTNLMNFFPPQLDSCGGCGGPRNPRATQLDRRRTFPISKIPWEYGSARNDRLIISDCTAPISFLHPKRSLCWFLTRNFKNGVSCPDFWLSGAPEVIVSLPC